MKLIGYLSLGYPNIKKTIDIARVYIESGIDVLEIDMPSKNPYLDSEFIRNRMLKALDVSSDYNEYMDAVLYIKDKYPNQEVFILCYEETVKEIGVSKFINFMNEANIENMIYVGGNDKTIKKRLIKGNIRLASYIPLNLNEEDLDASKLSNGFIYLQAKSDDINPKYPTLKDVIYYLKDNEGKNKKIYCGVGVKTLMDAKLVKDAGADGVFVGSTFLKLHSDIEKLKSTIKEFKKIID